VNLQKNVDLNRLRIAFHRILSYEDVFQDIVWQTLSHKRNFFRKCHHYLYPNPSNNATPTHNLIILTSSRLNKYSVRFEVLTAVVMKSTLFWDITPCSPVHVNRRFGETYRLHIQGRRISRARNQRKSRRFFHAGILLRLFFDPEDGGDIFLRNVG
jgi:hypothetical protein